MKWNYTESSQGEIGDKYRVQYRGIESDVEMIIERPYGDVEIAVLIINCSIRQNKNENTLWISDLFSYSWIKTLKR